MNTDKKKNQIINQAWIDYNPEIVKINEDKIKSFIINDSHRSVVAGAEIEALKENTLKESVSYLIGLNSINYQYWDLLGGEFLRYSNNDLVGALASFEGFSKLYAYMLENEFSVDLINVKLITKFYGDIPDKKNRVKILQESLNPKNIELVFNILDSHIKCSDINVELASKIAQVLPLSYDEPYLKKIQLALYAIAQLYNIKGHNIKCDITVPVDYQIPKVLEAEGVLEYCSTLQNKIKNFELIESQGAEERALRGATTIACEMISVEHNISIPALDRYLWLIRNNYKGKNFHLTKTTNY
jgi:hypothetical protein